MSVLLCRVHLEISEEGRRYNMKVLLDLLQLDNSSSSEITKDSQQEPAAAAAAHDDSRSAEQNSNELVCYFGSGSDRRPLGLAYWSPSRRRVWKLVEPASTCTLASSFGPCFQATHNKKPLEKGTLSHSVRNFFLRVPQKEELLYKTNPLLVFHHTWKELTDMGWSRPTKLGIWGGGRVKGQARATAKTTIDKNGTGLSDARDLPSQSDVQNNAAAKASADRAPAQRKRGRPPKLQGKVMQEAAPDQNKKRRGRPPKVHNADEQGVGAPAEKEKSGDPPRAGRVQGKSLKEILAGMEELVGEMRAHIEHEHDMEDMLAGQRMELFEMGKELKMTQEALKREMALRKHEKDTMEAYLKQQVQQSMEETVNQKVQEAMKSVFKSSRPG